MRHDGVHRCWTHRPPWHPSLVAPAPGASSRVLEPACRPKPRSPSRRPVQPSIRSRRPTTRTRTSEGVMTALGGISSGRTRNGSRNRAGVGSAGAPAASNRVQRRLPGLRVRAPVVHDLQPGGAQPVQLRQLDIVVDLDQELIPHGSKMLSILPFVVAARGIARISFPPGHHARAEELRGHERTAAISQDRLGHPWGKGSRAAQRPSPPTRTTVHTC